MIVILRSFVLTVGMHLLIEFVLKPGFVRLNIEPSRVELGKYYACPQLCNHYQSIAPFNKTRLLENFKKRMTCLWVNLTRNGVIHVKLIGFMSRVNERI